MKSHQLAYRLLELPDQFVYIHPFDARQAYPCESISARLNGIVLTPAINEKGGEA